MELEFDPGARFVDVGDVLIHRVPATDFTTEAECTAVSDCCWTEDGMWLCECIIRYRIDREAVDRTGPVNHHVRWHLEKGEPMALGFYCFRHRALETPRTRRQPPSSEHG